MTSRGGAGSFLEKHTGSDAFYVASHNIHLFGTNRGGAGQSTRVNDGTNRNFHQGKSQEKYTAGSNQIRSPDLLNGNRASRTRPRTEKWARRLEVYFDSVTVDSQEVVLSGQISSYGDESCSVNLCSQRCCFFGAILRSRHDSQCAALRPGCSEEFIS